MTDIEVLPSDLEVLMLSEAMLEEAPLTGDITVAVDAVVIFENGRPVAAMTTGAVLVLQSEG